LLHQTVSKGKWKGKGCLNVYCKGKKGRGRKETKRQAILEKREKPARREKKDGKGGIGRMRNW
jgi:hypothetical protein